MLPNATYCFRCLKQWQAPGYWRDIISDKEPLDAFCPRRTQRSVPRMCCMNLLANQQQLSDISEEDLVAQYRQSAAMTAMHELFNGCGTRNPTFDG